MYSRGNAQSICQAKIEGIYNSNLTVLKEGEFFDLEALKNPSGGTGNLVGIIAVVLIVLIIVCIIIKM